MTYWRSVHIFFYVRYTSQVQMSPQTFCRGNNWIYVCAFDAALIFTTFMHNVYKICGTFPLFHVCCSPIVSKVSKQKSIFFSKFQENWSFRDTGAKWTKIWTTVKRMFHRKCSWYVWRQSIKCKKKRVKYFILRVVSSRKVFLRISIYFNNNNLMII